MRYFIKYIGSALFAFFVIFVSQEAIAQSLAHFQTPAFSASGVSLTPTIRLYSTFRIDSSTIPFTGPDSGRPPILLISEHVYDSLPEFLYDSASASYYDAWERYSIRGTYSSSNDTTLDFLPYGLDLDGHYVSIVHNLKVLFPDSSIHEVPDTILTKFSTIQSPHHIVDNGVENGRGRIREGDTVGIRFNRKLDSINTPAGRLVEFFERHRNPVDSIPLDTSATHFIDSTVSYIGWVGGSDSSILFMKFTGIKLNQDYYVLFRPSRLSGDSAMDFGVTIRFRDQFQLTTSFAAVNPLDTVPSVAGLSFPVGQMSVFADDSIVLSPPSTIGSFIFFKWASASDSVLNGSVSNPLVISQSAASLHDVTLVATYTRTPSDTLTIGSASGGDVLVLNSSYSPLSSSTTYGVVRGDFLTLVPVPDSTHEFDHWSSTDSSFTDSTVRIPKMMLRANTGVTPVFTTLLPGLTYQLCGNIQFVDLPAGVTPSSIAELTNPNPPPCYSDPTPTTHLVTLHVLNHDYGLRQYVIRKPASTILVPNPAPTVEDLSPTYLKNVTETSTSGPTTVTFLVERLDADLNIEIAIEDGSKPDNDGVVWDGSKPNAFKEWISVSKPPIKPFSFDPWVVTTKPRDQWNATYKAAETLTLNASTRMASGLEGGYVFVGWSTSSGYTFPSTSTDPSFALTLHRDNSPIKVRAIFKRAFVLTQLHLFQDPAFTGTFTWHDYDPDPKFGNYFGFQSEVGLNDDGDFKNVIIKMDFNEEVDASTIPHSITCTETSERIDLLKTIPTIFPTTTGWGAIWPNATLTNGGKTIEWTVAFKVGSTNSGFCKMEDLVLSLTDQLKSVSGRSLANPRDFSMRTMTPDIKWTLDYIDVRSGNDWFSSTAEIFMPCTSFYVTDFATKSDYYVEWYPHVGDATSISGVHTYNQRLLYKDRVNPNATVGVSVDVWDKDIGNYYNQLIEYEVSPALIIDGLFGALGAGFAEEDAGYIATIDLLGAIFSVMLAIGIIIGLFAVLKNAFSNGDDNFGTAAWSGKQSNWWGARPSYRSELTRELTQKGDVVVKAKVELH